MKLSKKLLIFILTAGLSLFTFLPSASAAGEALHGILGGVFPSDVTLWGVAKDTNNPTNNTFQIKICFDDPTLQNNCAPLITANGDFTPFSPCTSAQCAGFHYLIPTGSVGSVTPRDGNSHMIYAKMVSQSNPGAGDIVVDGSPWPFTFKNGVVGPMWKANLESAPIRLTAAQLAIFANSNDPYSIGSQGTTVCTVNGTAIKNDGVVGYYAQKHGVPCTNINVVAVPVTAYLTQVNFNAAILPKIQALSPSVQAIALGWVQPSVVSSLTPATYPIQSICGVVAKGGMVTGTTSCGGMLGAGPVNPYFNSNSKTPFTDYSIRPTMLLAAERCTGCLNGTTYTGPYVEDFQTMKNVIDSAVTSANTNPTGGNVDWAWTSDSWRSTTAELVSPLSLGTALSPRIAGAQVLGSLASPVSSNVSAKNILLYANGSANWSYVSPTFIPGAAIGYSVTSTSGYLPYDGNQTPAVTWLSQGAVAGHGSGVEPCILMAYKNPDATIVIPNYTQGQTVIEALWKSVRLPWQSTFVGDPLAAPFTLTTGGPVTDTTPPNPPTNLLAH